MTLDTTLVDQPAAVDDGATRARQPHARWPYRWLVSGAITIACSICWPPLSRRPSVVILGLDEQFWSWLIAVGGAIAIGVGLIGVAVNVGRNHDAWWQGMLLTLFNSGVVLILCVGSIPALLIAALSFDTRYRDLGNAHGDGIIAAFTPSNGYTDAELVFGTRHGAFVDFDPRTRVIVTDRSLTLDDWHFALRTRATTIQVRTTRTSDPRDLAIATLTRTDASING